MFSGILCTGKCSYCSLLRYSNLYYSYTIAPRGPPNHNYKLFESEKNTTLTYFLYTILVRRFRDEEHD